MQGTEPPLLPPPPPPLARQPSALKEPFPGAVPYWHSGCAHYDTSRFPSPPYFPSRDGGGGMMSDVLSGCICSFRLGEKKEEKGGSEAFFPPFSPAQASLMTAAFIKYPQVQVVDAGSLSRTRSQKCLGIHSTPLRLSLRNGAFTTSLEEEGRGKMDETRTLTSIEYVPGLSLSAIFDWDYPYRLLMRQYHLITVGEKRAQTASLFKTRHARLSAGIGFYRLRLLAVSFCLSFP
ncbi:hypothetical protein L249_0221 [Ophiocordyceps polyrhachis-furcata BCC 54312]|uniref:Uncharacterized protein n=1 Tax=Ophiocordyceps polyrhachis-furcata BCC 54312 TaxID=1330021 RepID=A0A367LF95_9HYPO|nr:hypothetical protein L249_0221 [Ophiocordyceps polyrhachis-furcata BCC 54312]